MVIRNVNKISLPAATLETQVLENLSFIKPLIEKHATYGIMISKFISAVNITNVSPVKLLTRVFWIVILCPKSILALSKTITAKTAKPLMLKSFLILTS